MFEDVREPFYGNALLILLGIEESYV
ncbi:MAG: hypothetical protein RIT14_2574, partial [Pseudomonadota bacterium]